MQYLDEKKVIDLIDSSGGKILKVEFVKRTTGEVRKITCRKNVTSYLHGGELKYDPAKAKLITVFSMKDQGYRMIPVDAVVGITADGVEYRGEENEQKI